MKSPAWDKETKERTPQGGRDTKETKQLGEPKTRRGQHTEAKGGWDELHNIIGLVMVTAHSSETEMRGKGHY